MPAPARRRRVRSIVDVSHAEGFSTMRRFDSTFGTTDPHEAFKPPADDADAPAEPDPEREEAMSRNWLSGGGACPLICAMIVTALPLHDRLSAPPVGESHCPVRYSLTPF